MTHPIGTPKHLHHHLDRMRAATRDVHAEAADSVAEQDFSGLEESEEEE